jgi:hypothetical protein
VTLHVGLTEAPHAPAAAHTMQAAVDPLRQPDTAANAGGLGTGAGSGGGAGASSGRRGGRARGTPEVSAIAGSQAAGTPLAAAASSGVDITA